MEVGGISGPADQFPGFVGGDFHWTAPNAGQLVWRAWDGFYVVFNPASAEMHLLDPLGRELIDIIAEKPCSNEAIFAEMEKLFERELDQELSDKIIHSLAELDNIGLIAPAHFNPPHFSATPR